MKPAEALGVALGASALAIALVALLKQPKTSSLLFDSNLVPLQADTFALGSSVSGLDGVWLGAHPDRVTVDSVTNRLVAGSNSYTTFQDLTSFSTATLAFNPSFGAFYSTQNQYMGQVTVSAGLSSQSSLFYNFETARTSDIVCSVTKPSTGGNSVSGDSKVFVMTSGIYKISTSIQFAQTANAVTPVSMWLAVDGVAVPDTGSIATIQQQNGELFTFVEFFQTMSASQFFEIKWNSFGTTSWAAAFTTGNFGSVSGSNIPSVITNIVRIG